MRFHILIVTTVNGSVQGYPMKQLLLVVAELSGQHYMCKSDILMYYNPDFNAYHAIFKI